jgi:predicted transcriptional regulator
MAEALAKREREILDILYRRGRATANEVMEDLDSGRTYSTVRSQLRLLEQKGHARHEVEGTRFVYLPAVPRHTARKSALRHLMDTFFEGSPERLVAALLGDTRAVSDDDLDRIAAVVSRAEKEGR